MSTSFPVQGICAISDLGLIRAQGADAASFLQGQLTNDVLTLDGSHARLAGFCSAKGRLQASFIVWRECDDGFLLACSASLLAPTLKRLSMFVMRAKCKLTDASVEVALRGSAGASADAWVGGVEPWARVDRNGVTAIRLPDAAGVRRALLIAEQAIADTTIAA